MIKHIVVLKLKEHALGKSKAENARMLKRELESLKPKIAEIRKLEVGIGVTQGPEAYDLALYSEFENQKDLERYLKHPEHLRVGEIVGSVRETRIVVDYEG